MTVIAKSLETSLLRIPADYLTEGAHYEVSVNIVDSSGSEGRMYYDFYVNFHPRGGVCYSDKAEG